MTNNRWYEDPRLLRAAYDKYGSFIAVEENIGGADSTTLQRWWRQHGFPKLPRGPQPAKPPNREVLEELHRNVYGGDARS